MGLTNPFVQTNWSDISVHTSMPLTNAGKTFNVVDNTSNDYNTNCIDRWRPIKAYIIEHGSITKRGIKATMARCCGTIYKHSTEPIQCIHNQKRRHNSNLWYFLETFINRIYYRSFFGRHHTGDHLKKALCDIFKYRDEVVGSFGQVHLTEDFYFINLHY